MTMSSPLIKPAFERSTQIDRDVSVPLVQVLAGQAAAVAGADDRQRAEFVTAATEAATNILRHASRGVVVVRAFIGPPAELEFEAHDEGPGIVDLGAAQVDGFSRGKLLEVSQAGAQGIGCGIGAMRRFMDRLTLETSPRGTRVSAQKRVGRR